MEHRTGRIVVAGDVTVDWFMRPVGPGDTGENWRLHPALHSHVRPGGAAMLAEFIRKALESPAPDVEVLGPELPGDLRSIPPEQIIQSNALLDTFPRSRGSGETVLRVREPHGYVGPRSGPPRLLPPVPDPSDADVIVLDDAGNGFRDVPEAWPRALGPHHRGIVVHKMSRPLSCGPLLERLITLSHPAEEGSPVLDDLVVVVSADDLRGTEGVNISKGLSWERTAKDFVFQIHRSTALQGLEQCPYLVVLFGHDGAILYRGREGGASTLVFDPGSLEGDFAASVAGTTHGRSAIFTAALVASLVHHGITGLESGLRAALFRSRRLLEAGYVVDFSGQLGVPLDRVFDPSVAPPRYATCTIEPAVSLREPDPRFWRMLDQKTRNGRRSVASETILRGDSDSLEDVPVGAFGEVATIDRAEIESYSAIRQLILEFLATPVPRRPLCFAVFGPPGSGKSFGVKQVMRSIGSPLLTSQTFNVSQFGGYADLVAAFHKVRDEVLAGKVPFVFFDEFDSAFGEQPLGWLKYFLAPMQDGEFKDGEVPHPIGKAVFVFAGGTRPSFQAFVNNVPDESSVEGPIPLADEHADGGGISTRGPVEPDEAFRRVKGPDFVSRLRGFINVMGPNRQPSPGDDDEPFVIRRAKVLWKMLRGRAPDLFGSGEARIDPNVLRALLEVSRYKHGARSMEAILDMSRLSGKRRFDRAALPPRDQLDIHVDAEEFLFLAEKERYLSIMARRDHPCRGEPTWRDPSPGLPGTRWFHRLEAGFVDAVARALHREYLGHRKVAGQPVYVPESFDDLSDRVRGSNVDAAEDVPRKLQAIGHAIRRIPAGKAPRTPDITDEELERLARMEHDRFCHEKHLQGYRPGERTDHVARTTPYLVPFDQLPDEVKAYDREAVQVLPRIFKDLGYELFRTIDVDEFEDPDLIQMLARLVHKGYLEERGREGDTPGTNPSMVPFDELPDDLREANLDNARTVPRKLASVGLALRRRRTSDPPGVITLTDHQIEEMSKMEHARWNWQKVLQGWVYSPGDKNIEQRTTPHLVPWKELSPHIQDLDRQTVRLIPELLGRAGYWAYPEVPEGDGAG